MGSLDIRQITIDDLRFAPGVDALLREYSQECGIAGLPKPKAEWLTYARLEHHGALHVVGAYLDGSLVGFCHVLVSLNPHYSALLAVTESLFVATAHRGTGAGLALLREAEAIARHRGAVGLLVSAPTGGSLAAVLERSKGFRETNRAFLQELRP